MQNKTLIGLYILATIIASVHLYLLPDNTFGGTYTHYNNFIIFKYSFWHLINGQDLYIEHLTDQYDLFKYSPAFALAMAPFALLPNWFGLVIWNLLNTSLLLWAVFKLKLFTNTQKQIALLLIFFETLTSLQSAQTNVMMVALFLFAYHFFETDKPHWAALMLMLSVFIKLFGLILFPLFLLYKYKEKFIVWSAVWFMLLLAIPLLVVNMNQLLHLYISWWNMLQQDHSVSFGLSVMGWLKTWFFIEPNKTLVVGLGLLILLVSIVLHIKTTDWTKRALLFASSLIWVIIFNHKAESSTFNIALVGVAIYYLVAPPSKLKNGLLVFCLLFTSLSPTDLFPPYVRVHIVTPYVLKAVPCIFIWFHINYLLFSRKQAFAEPVLETPKNQ
ncbi:MAG: glycosyltransferase family 87 protein [Bacteroidota bacterium]